LALREDVGAIAIDVTISGSAPTEDLGLVRQLAIAAVSEFGQAPRPPHLADGPYAVESESRTLH